MFESKDWKAEVERICGSVLDNPQCVEIAILLGKCEVGSQKTRDNSFRDYSCVIDFLWRCQMITDAMRLELRDYGHAACAKIF